MDSHNGNDRTISDPTWVEAVPTGQHPEYPAAPACVAASVAKTLSAFCGTRKVVFTVDSTVTASTLHHQSVNKMEAEHTIPHLARDAVPHLAGSRAGAG